MKLFDENYASGHFEMIGVKDIGMEGAYDEAVKGTTAPTCISKWV